jgi:flagellar motility protein MotE (MotC chaperone)
VIVTRQRRKPFPFKRLLLPLIAIALVAFAFVWPPSRNILLNGPAAPVARSVGNAYDNVAQPFHFAAQNQVITERGKEIAALTAQLTTAQAQEQDKAKQVTALQQQIDQLQTQAASSRNNASPAPGRQSSAPRASGGAPAGTFSSSTAQGGGYVAGDLSSGATADMRRTGAYWSSMEPENAAKIAQNLPTSYVARVFAQMAPGDVGAILDALPASYAAKLTAENPEIQH